MTAIIALKVFLTLWAIFWFALLGKIVIKERDDPDVWFTAFLAWFALLVTTHMVLLVPFGVFSLIWFGF